jgi:hypothetical protein
MGDGVVACWDGEDVPLEVLPLASVVPQEGVDKVGLSVMGEVGKNPPPSDWVLGKYHHFGDFVGASYEGYEEEVLALLKSIDARHTNLVNGEEVSDISGRSGRKGSKELKGLVGTINCNIGSSRSRGNKKERVLLLSQWMSKSSLGIFEGLMIGTSSSKLEVLLSIGELMSFAVRKLK